MCAQGAACRCVLSNLVNELSYVGVLVFELGQERFGLWLDTTNSSEKDVLFGREVWLQGLPKKTHRVACLLLGTVVRFAILWQTDCEAKSEQQAAVMFTREGHEAGMSLWHTFLNVNFLHLGRMIHDEGKPGLDVFAHQRLDGGLSPRCVSYGNAQQGARAWIQRSLFEGAGIHLA